MGILLRILNKNFLILFYVVTIIYLNVKLNNAISCPTNTWACNNGIQCINSTFRCNNVIDCNDGSDEASCSKFIFLN